MFDATSRGLFINWTEPHGNNAPITGYNITYQNPDCLVMASNNELQEVTVTSMMEQVMITYLHPGENYTVIVIAINDICPSVPSIPVSVRTMEEGILLENDSVWVDCGMGTSKGKTTYSQKPPLKMQAHKFSMILYCSCPT